MREEEKLEEDGTIGKQRNTSKETEREGQRVKKAPQGTQRDREAWSEGGRQKVKSRNEV